MTTQELLDRAIEEIISVEADFNFICEQMHETPEHVLWCSENCKDDLRKECVLYYLEHAFKKK